MLIKKIQVILSGLTLLIAQLVVAQDQKLADSLAAVYQQNALTDSAKMKLLTDLSFNETRDQSKGLHYAEELLAIAEKNNNLNFERIANFLIGNKKRSIGKLDEALASYIKAAELSVKINNEVGEGEAYGAIADIYVVGKNEQNAFYYYRKAIASLQHSKKKESLASVMSNTGDAFMEFKHYDSALAYFIQAKAIFDSIHYTSGIGYSLGNIGMVYAYEGRSKLAEETLNEAISILEKKQDYYPICVYLTSMSDIYWQRGEKQTALDYALRSLKLATQYDLKEQVSDASLKLSQIYEGLGKPAEALVQYKNHISTRDSINNIRSVQKLADLRTNYEVSQKQAEVNLANQQKRDQRNLSIALAVILALTIGLLAILYQYDQNKQKAYKVLNRQKQETDLQKAKAETALEELQSTQKMLIHSAKMASLGELTAGIAHEIQNPLNFVNNFSEVSVELLEELKDEAVKKLTGADKDDIEDIISDLGSNLKKITEHGKRADSIVRGMLEHSRTSSGSKEFTDINAFADEYLRLSYHGIRAKDKLFNAWLHSNYDPQVGLVELVPQDLGRVLLNLYNNAFYAVREKAKTAPADFKPTVTVTTRKHGAFAEISVRDNGTGIPNEIAHKIFQPFFTTKPTGQGTGLGLSLSYDIIKAHGGELIVNTEPGEYAEFIIQLPSLQKAAVPK